MGAQGDLVKKSRAALPNVSSVSAPMKGLVQRKNEDPATIMNRMMKQDNPYMELAATEGKQQAQQRGLLSSSMAVGAVADSRARAALPLTQQRAQQNATSNLSTQEFRQQTGLQGQRIKADALTQNRDIASREGMQTEALTSAEKSQLRDIKSREKLESQRRDLELKMQSRGLTAAEESQLRDINSQEKRLNATIKSDENQRRLDRDLQTKLADWNLDADEQKSVAAFIQNSSQRYESALDAIMRNTDYSHESRQKSIEALQARRTKEENLVREIFNVDIGFGD